MQGGAVVAAPPPALAGLIEARGVGLLRLPFRPSAQIVLAVTLAHPKVERLPRRSTRLLLKNEAPLISVRPDAAGAAIVAALLRGADLIDPDAGG
jgi:HPr kinase/phosphorylase